MSPYDIDDDFGGGLYPSGGMYGGMYGLTEEDKRKARNMGLMSAGLGILAANQPSPHPKSALGVFGQGGLQGLNAYQGDLKARMGEKGIASNMAMNDARMKSMQQMADARSAEQQAKAAQQQATAAQEQERLNAFAATLPPEQQAAFRVNPPKFMEEYNRQFAPTKPEAKPNEQQLYEYAVTNNGYKGTLVEFMQENRRAGATSIQNNIGPTGIDYGNPPKDMAWAREPDGRVKLEKDPKTGHMRPVAVPVGGGSVEREAASAEAKAASRQTSQNRYADVVTEDVQRVTDMVNKSMIPVTGFASLASAVPGTPQHNIAKLVDGIKANVSFDRLQLMRENSPTGGALGQVSDFENRLLQSTLGSLEQSQGKEQFIYNLKRLNDIYQDIIHGPGNRPEGAKKPPAKAEPKSKLSAEEAKELEQLRQRFKK
jgi:hypothetical protein